MARYSVNNYTVDVLLADIKSGNATSICMGRNASA